MQNINIKYNVDKSQVDASNQSVEKAKNLTDQLTSSTQKLGQQGSKTSSQYSNSIEGMRIKVAQLKAQIELANQSDTKRLATLKTQYAAAQRQLESYTSALKVNEKVSQQVAAATQGSTNSFLGLGNFIKAGLIVAAAKQLGEAAIEATKLAGNVEGVQKGFERAFPNATKILNDLRTATKSTVTDFELMQRTLQATNLGVDVEKLPILFEFAAARAQQTGESVDYLVDSIVRGIGRKSILVLDNLGLSATRLKEQFNGASIASKSVAEVTAGVAAIAKVELDKMGGYVDNGATKVARLSAAWENLRIAFSKRIEGSVIVNFFTQLTDDVKALITSQKDLADQEAKNRAAREVDAFVTSKAYESTKDNIENRIYLLSLEITRQINLINARKSAIKSLEEQKKAQDDSNMSGGIAIERLNKIISQQELGKKTAEESIEILRKYVIQLRELENKKPIDTLDELEKKVKELNDELKNTDEISTRGGVDRARVIKKEIKTTEDKIESIKLQIYWEEELQRRRSTIDKNATKDIEEIIKKQDELREKEKAKNNSATTKLGGGGGIMKDLNDLHSQISTEGLDIVEITPVVKNDAWDKLAAAFKDNAKMIADRSIDILVNGFDQLITQDAQQYSIRITQAERFYDHQIKLAGDNDRAKAVIEEKRTKQVDKLRREQFVKEKNARRSVAIINAAGAAARAFVDYEYPLSLIIAALAAGEAAIQVGIINKEQPAFKEGVIDFKGKGTKTSDSNLVRISNHESVMTGDETQSSNRTLKMIRAKKLNDKVLDKIIQRANSVNPSIGFDDRRLLAATNKVAKAAAGNDLVRKGSHIYEAKKEGENLTKYIRSKTLNG